MEIEKLDDNKNNFGLSEEALLYLLKIINKDKGNLIPIVNMGFTYKEIADAINRLVNNEYIERNVIEGNVYIIKQKGQNLLDELNKTLKRKNLGKFIEPFAVFRIPKMSIDDIFVPNLNELPKSNTN